MIIGVTDVDQYKFSGQLIDHWESLGHEVRKSIYHEPKFVDECDVLFYDYASMMVVQLAKDGKKPKRCVVRSIDVENYMNYHQGFNYDFIDSFICLNNAQYDLLKSNGFSCPEDKVHIIQAGINRSKYTLVQNRQENPLKIVYVGRFWIGKAVLGALNIAEAWKNTGKNVELHICGTGFDPCWWKKQVEYRMETSKVPIFLTQRVEDMNQYLEDKSLMIVPSFKEAFSYVTAETLSKGIPVIMNDWYGSREVWPENLIYRNDVEAIAKAEKLLTWTPEELRQLTEKYDEQIMFNKMDKLMGL